MFKVNQCLYKVKAMAYIRNMVKNGTLESKVEAMAIGC